MHAVDSPPKRRKYRRGTRHLRGQLRTPLLDGMDNRTSQVLRVRLLAQELAGGRELSTAQWSACIDAAVLILRLRDITIGVSERVRMGHAADAALRRAGLVGRQP